MSAAHDPEDELYIFTQNDPYNRTAPIRLVLPQRISSRDYMRSIRSLVVPQDSIAIWFLGQNGFLLKDPTGLLIGIDLYLTNSCTTKYAQLPYRLDRQLPVFIEPEDLDIDVFLATHSHDDHADAETIQRMPKSANIRFLGPFDAMRVFRECGVSVSSCQLIHPGESISLGKNVSVHATFALPTDNTDLNHTGMLIESSNAIRFYNTGDTAYADRLSSLLPTEVDVCAICINGGFHNLTPLQAAAIVKMVRPRVVVPCHYDMMVNNVGSPEMFRVALHTLDVSSAFHIMPYYLPWIYRRV
jgi:L-ascorbate 6-phosphate lactonase